MSVTLDGVLQTICAMDRYSRGGFGWGQGMLHNYLNGRKCLVGLAQSVRASNGNASWIPAEEIEAAKHFIKLAVLERGGGIGFGGDWTIMSFNDTHSYHDVAAVIRRAKQLAVMSYQAAQPPAPPLPVPGPVRALPAPVASVPQVLPPPVRPALPAPAPVVIDAEWEPVPVREARDAAEQVTRELDAISAARAVWR